MDTIQSLSIVMLIPLFIVLYVVGKIPFYILAKKAGHRYPYFAFIPILDGIQMINIAGSSGFLILLFFVPIVNIIFGIYIGYKYYTSFENGGMVFAITVIVSIVGYFIPLVGLISLAIIYWLAFSDSEYIGICI
jgi:hypothetical protein